MHFSEPLIEDGFRVAFLPWVARSKVLLRNDRIFVRVRLPRAIDILPFQGGDRSRIVNSLQMFDN